MASFAIIFGLFNNENSFDKNSLSSVINDKECKSVAISEIDLQYPQLNSIYIYEPIPSLTYFENIKEEIDSKNYDCIIVKDSEINKQLLHILNIDKTIKSEITGTIIDSGRENIRYNFIVIENNNQTQRYLIPKNVKAYVSRGEIVTKDTELYFGLKKILNLFLEKVRSYSSKQNN